MSKSTIEIEKGRVCIDIDDLVAGMSDEQKAMLLKSEVIEDRVLGAITDYLCTGTTEDGWWTSGDHLTKLQVRILARLDEMRNEVIADLVRGMESAQHYENLFKESYYKLAAQYRNVSDVLWDRLQVRTASADSPDFNVQKHLDEHFVITRDDVPAILEFIEQKRKAQREEREAGA